MRVKSAGLTGVSIVGESPMGSKGKQPLPPRVMGRQLCGGLRSAHDFTIDPREASVLEQVLAQCESADMKSVAYKAGSGSEGKSTQPTADGHALAMYDDN